MSSAKSVDPLVDLTISQRSDGAPRGSVTTFCLEHDLSRQSCWAIRKRERSEGQPAALYRTRRPVASPNRISDEVGLKRSAFVPPLNSQGLKNLRQTRSVLAGHEDDRSGLVARRGDAT